MVEKTVDKLLDTLGVLDDENLPATLAEAAAKLDAYATWSAELTPTQRDLGADRFVWLFGKLGHPEPWRTVRRAVERAKVETERGSWRWYDDGELRHLPTTEELVVGHLPQNALALLYGPTGQGKTFVALDLALSVGTGIPWLKHDVVQGPVAYILAEGWRGLAARVDAWKFARGFAGDSGVRCLLQPVRFLEPTDTAQLLAELGTWDPPPRLLVVDPLSPWCLTPENEADMGVYVRAIGELRAKSGGTVLTVHHTGHDQTRPRSYTTLADAQDTIIRAKQDGGTLKLSCDKNRDAPMFEAIRLTLAPYGESVVPILAETEREQRDTPTAREKEALEALKAIAVPGEGVPTSRWDQSAGLAHGTFYRSRRKLIEMGLVYVEKKRNFPADSPDESQGPIEVPF